MGSLMGLIGSVIVVIAALAQCTAAETTYIVGDSNGWRVQSYDSWVSGKTFAVGDKLNFTFNAQFHDVAQVSKTDYDSCTNTSTIFLGTTSPTIITLNSTGEHYYICTFTGHCAGGQKLSINVVSSTTSPGPSPPPTAGSTPPTATPPTAGSTPPTAGSTPPTANSPPTHIVGDSNGWRVQSYDSWVSGKTFAVGDKLNFTFNAQAHDVAQVSKTDYDSCTSTSTIFLGTTSPTIVTLNSTGEHYYICTFTGHCAGGQKLSINVVSSTTEPSSPSPPPTAGSGSSPPRTPSSTPSPLPPPSSSSSSTSSGVSTGVIVGVAAAGILAVVVVLGLIFFCCRKKRRRQHDPSDHYGHAAPVPPPKDDPYGGQPQNWQHNVPPPADHVVKIRPPNSPKNSPTLPPPVFSSSGGSGSNYSGSAHPLPPPSPGIALGFSKSTFTLEELTTATDGFSDANLLGQGGFGYVHRGVLANGKEVAIKSLKSGSGQGEREFQAEVEIISRVHHKHLVSLVGYCMAGGQRMLVYEFVPNNTLEFHLHGKGRPTMEWPLRLKIALGSAKGLAYLHEDCHPKIIHRDIKASNILLDFKFEAQVADFGLAKFASDTNTHVSTRVMGTFGYLDPEYASSGKLTDKSDVFSFGVMLLELITGRRPVDTTQSSVDDSLVDWARPLLTRSLKDGNYDSLVDQRLQKNYNPVEMTRMVACAAACVRHSAPRRPRMSQIVRALEGDVSLDAVNEGVVHFSPRASWFCF